MNNSQFKKIKFVAFIAILGIAVWFIIISPIMKFHDNEDKLTAAAKRYFEINSDKLPVGERVRTITLNTLYKEAYLEDDFTVPYTGKVCSLENSWVKVTRVNGEYKYYTYLDCGVLKSFVDHEGPKIKLNGDSEITINMGDEYKEPGVSSVVDNEDGKLKTDDVVIKGTVDTSKTGVYEVEYSSFDKLSNKGTVKRTVTVVNRLGVAIKRKLNDDNYFKGTAPNNYIYFSNMLFRILSIDGDNVRIVSDRDISNVNYDGISDWFKYFDSNLTDEAKELIVKNKYCNMSINDSNIDSTKCSKYGKKTKYGLLSITDINNANSEDENYLVRKTITWTSNSVDKKNSYATRYIFSDTDRVYRPFENTHNLGIRPVITISGSNLIMSGDGTAGDPYKLKDYKKVVKGSKLNTRLVGEYVNYSGIIWVIQGIESDGTIKVISDYSINEEELRRINYSDKIKNTQYNPTEKGNVGYIINNSSSKYIDTSLAVNHDIVVPIYKKEASYNKEIKTKKYKAKISSPNIYDMFSAASSISKSYWVLNSSTSTSEYPGVSDTGVVMYGAESKYYSYGIRPVIYLKKNVTIANGAGTSSNPFNIK